MSESEFIDICTDLHDNLLKLNEDKENTGPFGPKLSISLDTEQIIESHGFIETSNDEIKEIYQQVFNIVCNIRNYSRDLEHFRSRIHSMMIKNIDNDEELASNCSMFAFCQKSLKAAYEKTLTATEKLFDLGKTK